MLLCAVDFVKRLVPSNVTFNGYFPATNVDGIVYLYVAIPLDTFAVPTSELLTYIVTVPEVIAFPFAVNLDVIVT